MVEKPGLVRAFGLWSLAAIGANMVVGAAFFILPATYFGLVGAWSPWLLIIVGLCLLPVGFCFAEAGSRFASTGGPYLYTRTAFGPFIGFEIGWLIWIMRVISHASVLAALAVSLGYFFPGVLSGWGKAVLLLGVTLPLVILNIVGSREGAVFLLIVTVCKFLPLIIFVGVGFGYIEWARFGNLPEVSIQQVSQTALLMAFSLGGFEMLTVPAGEAKNPHKHVPQALVTTVLFTVAIAVLANMVVIGTLADPAASQTPMATAAAQFLGPAGVLGISAAVVISVVGHNMGSLVSVSRVLFGLAEHGDMPRFFARLHPRFNTPHAAIVVTGGAAVLLAFSGSFENLVAISAITRIFVYLGVALATLRLRSARYDAIIGPPQFAPPLKGIMPWCTVAVSVFFLLNMTSGQLMVGAAAIAVGAAFYAFRRLLGGR